MALFQNVARPESMNREVASSVVGPTRMDYAKVTARLSYFAESLSKMFAKPEQPQLPAPNSEEE